MSDKNPNANDDRGLARRDFFRHFLLKGLNKAEESGKKVAGRFNDVIAAAGDVRDSIESRPTPPPTPMPASEPARFLRPPGALAELSLAETCSRCGDCVRSCPAQAIRLEPGVAGGLPFIVPREQPCVVCTDLSCMKVCPTGALKMVSAVSEVSMGIAVMDHARCLRGPFDDELSPDASESQATGPGFHGEDCRLCVTSCPVGETAMTIDGMGKISIIAGCIGCGVCERACPTEPSSVFVRVE